MDKNNLKNIVVLKNLPSNIVDEAIVILKPNQKIKRIEIIDNKSNNKQLSSDSKKNIHVINEAELLVSSYISKIEKKDKETNYNDALNNKYKRLKKYSLFTSLLLILSILLHLIWI